MSAGPTYADIVGLSEIADLYTSRKLPVNRQLVNRWSQVEGFPAPIRVLRQGRLWSALAVAAWISENRPDYFEAARKQRSKQKAKA